MKLFDFSCESKMCLGRGRTFEAYVNDDDEVVECPFCKTQAVKQLGGKPMCKSSSQDSFDNDVLSSSYEHDHKVTEVGSMSIPITDSHSINLHVGLIEYVKTPKGKA